MSEQRAAGQTREQSRLVDGRLRVQLLLLPSHFVWRQHKKSREIAVYLSGRNDPRTRLAFLSGDDGCFSSGGIQLPHMWIPVKLFSSLFFTPFCIQVFKGSFRKLQLASAGVDSWHGGLVKARRLNSQVFIAVHVLLQSDCGVESALVRTCSPFTTFVQFCCSLLCLTWQIDCCAPSQLVPCCSLEFSKGFERSLLVWTSFQASAGTARPRRSRMTGLLKTVSSPRPLSFKIRWLLFCQNNLPRMEQC